MSARSKAKAEERAREFERRADSAKTLRAKQLFIIKANREWRRSDKPQMESQVPGMRGLLGHTSVESWARWMKRKQRKRTKTRGSR